MRRARASTWVSLGLGLTLGLEAGAAGTPEGGTAPAATAAGPEAASGAPSQGKGMLLQGTSDKPLAIQSEELEAVEEGGARRLLFTRSVHVTQGDLSVHSNRLEAYYPKGSEQPDRLVADGQVRVQQGDRKMSCNRATYYQLEERLLCVGAAELREGENQVRGDQIEIFFEQDKIRVKGGAVVNVTPRKKEKAGAPAPAAEGAKPAGSPGGPGAAR